MAMVNSRAAGQSMPTKDWPRLEPTGGAAGAALHGKIDTEKAWAEGQD